MRINLKVPYVEKDQAKGLGARWDPQKKTWYLVHVEDLTPFMRWIPHSNARTRVKKMERAVKSWDKLMKPVFTKSAVLVPHCGCYDIPPWEDCEHTADTSIDDDQRAHLRSILFT